MTHWRRLIVCYGKRMNESAEPSSVKDAVTVEAPVAASAALPGECAAGVRGDVALAADQGHLLLVGA